MKKKFYKNNVGCYYFYAVSISGKFERIVLSYEKLVNEFEKICNSLENGLFLEISYKKIIKFLDTFYK